MQKHHEADHPHRADTPAHIRLAMTVVFVAMLATGLVLLAPAGTEAVRSMLSHHAGHP